MRKFALLSCFVFLCLVTFAFAQQGDIMVGGGILLSPRSNSASVTPPPTEKGGKYINLSGDLVKFKHRTGFNVETA